MKGHGVIRGKMRMIPMKHFHCVTNCDIADMFDPEREVRTVASAGYTKSDQGSITLCMLTSKKMMIAYFMSLSNVIIPASAVCISH